MTEVGGNTACLEIRSSTGALVVLDAGIGIYWLGRSLLAGPHGRGQGETSILLTRTYWDHIQGFPFFIPAFIPGNKIHLYGPTGSAKDLEAILEGQMRPAYSPIVSLGNMGSSIEFKSLGPGEVEIGGLRIQHEILVTGEGRSPSCGYRIEENGRSFAYVSDVEYSSGKVPSEVLRLTKDVDLLIHESFYTNDEQRRGEGAVVGSGFGPSARRGHATFAEALEVALRGRVKRLLFSHHHPDHDDGTIQAAVEGERSRAASRSKDLVVDTAREGQEIEV
jgi:phosphoribosyl 1,2-cyclic phosphodiesterase